MCVSLTSPPLCFFSFLTILNNTAEFKLVTRNDITFESFIIFFSLFPTILKKKKINQWTRLYPLRHDSKLEIMRYCREQRQTARQLLECCLSLWIVLVTRRSSPRSSVLACARNKMNICLLHSEGCSRAWMCWRRFQTVLSNYSCNFWGGFLFVGERNLHNKQQQQL